MRRFVDRLDAAAVARWVREYYHLPALFGLTAFMLSTRTENWQSFVTDERVLFRGNDAWYHYRHVTYAVERFPGTLAFDPWTAFPRGADPGQFGTVYDQTVALAALLAGGGDPGETTVGLALLFAPAVLGTLVAVPTYLLGVHYADRPGGVVAVTVLALTPGGFLQRTTVGFADHHAAEALCQAVAILAVATALRTAQRREPAFALLLNGEYDRLRRPLVAALLSGVAVAAYVLVWPPGVVLALVLAACYALHASVAFVRGTAVEPVAFVGVVSAVATATVLLGAVSAATFDHLRYSLLQPALFALVATGLAVLVGLARVVEARSLPRWTYPAAVAAGGALGTGLVRAVAPATFDFFASYLVRAFGYSLAPVSPGVGETRRVAAGSVGTFLELSYGFAFAAAVGGVLFVGHAYLRGRATPASDTRAPGASAPLLVVWFAFMTAAALTQVRFDYYLAVPVAVLTGVFAGRVVRAAGVDAGARLADVGAREATAVALVGLLVVGPFVASVGAGGVTFEATAAAATNGPDEVTEWAGTLAWLRANTPPEGLYATPDGPRFPSFPPYPASARAGDFAYPPGTYGVLSWWDVGHYVTVLGERIPVANPFQDGRTAAAAFFLSTNESAASERVSWGDERVRYVLLDRALVVPGAGKYASPLPHANATGDTSATGTAAGTGSTNLGALVGRVTRFDAAGRRVTGFVGRQRHYETLRVRLYRYHGSARAPEPVVVDWETRRVRAADGGVVERAVVPAGDPLVRRFDTLAAARAYVRRDGSARVGGVGGLPAERVPALEHYRLVHASDATAATATVAGTTRGPWAKVFERVPGAAVDGRAPPNATVTASVRLSVPGRGTFTYTQRARSGPDGAFSMTLPYSTTGYGARGVAAGYTNVSVRATGPYTLAVREPGAERPAATAAVAVPAGKVVGADSAPLNVTVRPD